jgi:hypothetical protein
MQRKDAPTTRRAYVDHLRAGIALWPLFLMLVRPGRAPVADDLPPGAPARSFMPHGCRGHASQSAMPLSLSRSRLVHV